MEESATKIEKPAEPGLVNELRIQCPGCGNFHTAGHDDSCACDHCKTSNITAPAPTKRRARQPAEFLAAPPAGLPPAYDTLEEARAGAERNLKADSQHDTYILYQVRPIETVTLGIITKRIERVRKVKADAS